MLPDNNNNNIQTSSGMKANSVNGYMKILDMLIVFASKWYWIVLCMLIGAACAMFYLLSTPKEYSRAASILIKNDMNSRSSYKSASGLNFFGSNVELNNELYTLRSPNIIDSVVSRMHLEMEYKRKGMFHDVVLFGYNMPVDVRIKGLNDYDDASFTMELGSNKSFILSGFSLNGSVSFHDDVKGVIGKPVDTPVGTVIVTPSQYYKPVSMKFDVYRNNIHDAKSEFYSRYWVKPQSEDATIINVCYQDVSAQRAEEILANVIKVYNELWIQDNNQVAKSTSDFIMSRLEDIEAELGDVESDISSFKSRNLIPAQANDVGSMYVGQAQEASNRISQIGQELYMARYVRNYLNNATGNQLIPGDQGLSNTNLSGQINQYNQYLQRRNTIAAQSSNENPIVQELDVELNQMHNALVSSVDNHIVNLNSQMHAAQSQQSRSNSKIAASPGQSKYLLGVERQQKVKESLYLFLLQKREENNLSQAFIAYNTRTISDPAGSNRPVFPIPANVWILCLSIGFAIPTLIIFLIESINNKVRGRKDLDDLSIPFIGEIPYAIHKKHFSDQLKKFFTFSNPFKKKRKKEDKTIRILVKDKSRNIINEAFRVIRTNIEFMSARGEHGNVIMLTSFNPNSGKTFVASNLVTSFAIKNAKVLAIDLDLRKASLSAMIEKRDLGVSDYLSGMVKDYNDVIVRGETHENLDIMPVGTIPPNPTELLFEPRLHELLEAVREEYDYVFLDCPPVEIVADATIVGREADMSLFLIRAELLDRRMLPEVQKYYDEQRLPKMSIILNGTTDAFSYYGYHRYGSRYGYYGYSSYGGYTHNDE